MPRRAECLRRGDFNNFPPSVVRLIPSLSCRRCSPRAPFAKLEMLSNGGKVGNKPTALVFNLFIGERNRQ